MPPTSANLAPAPRAQSSLCDGPAHCEPVAHQVEQLRWVPYPHTGFEFMLRKTWTFLSCLAFARCRVLAGKRCVKIKVETRGT